MRSPSKALPIVFLVLFLDLMAFSIIFPLYPAMMQNYLAQGSEGIFPILYQRLLDWTGGEASRAAVLFAGILGCAFSLMQFIGAPVWGRLSDRWGRRKVLILTIGGTALGHALWAMSGSFEWLLASRLLAGFMAGNLAVATAVVADITGEKERSKGMVLVGIAFGLGMLCGPAIGGLASLGHAGPLEFHNLSLPAWIAAGLSLVNLIWLLVALPETLPARKMPAEENAFPVTAPDIRRCTLSNFGFLLAFSGMEFTLTFLAVERFLFSPAQNSGIFIFVAVMLLIIQGGLVRRMVPKTGEKKMLQAGLAASLISFALIGFANSPTFLFIGLGFLALGAATVQPMLTALVSLKTKASGQGAALGRLRAAGSAARAFGPLVAAYLYFQTGSLAAYLIAAVWMIPVLVLVGRISTPADRP